MTVQTSKGNSATLTKVDKLRERLGTSRISLPQLVVVGDQSSGKSSVLEGITGFAFPRAAELCTRYATQITCKREDRESITVSIIPHVDASPQEKERLQKFSATLTDLTEAELERVFRQANKAMDIEADLTTGKKGSAFSEHVLKIQITGPDQEHFTVIDVPGIFRRETAGLTTENDIALVRRMVKTYMKDERTIILAIIPSNVDPATQEILKLAKEVDPEMKRTMGVLTKPDLNIERVTQQIAIDHVVGKRSDLTLGYYIVKNRGPDDIGKTLSDGQHDESAFFASDPWSILRGIGRAGIPNRNHILDTLQKSYDRAINHTKLLLRIERQGTPYTLNPFFNENLQKAQNSRMTKLLEAAGTETRHTNKSSGCFGDDLDSQDEGIFIARKTLTNLSSTKSNADQIVEQIHDVLKSYYEVARKRFVDVVCQQVVNHFLLSEEEGSPLQVLTSKFVRTLGEEHLDEIAGEDAAVRAHRAKLDRDIGDFEMAWKILKGSA